MPTLLASGSKTILDLTDGGILSAYLTCNQPRVQVYDSETNTYAPNWTTSNVVIEPSVYLDQTRIELNDTHLTLAWTRKDGNGSESALTTGESVSNGVLTVSQNKLSTSPSGILTYVLTTRYIDNSTSTDMTIKSELEFTLSKSGASVTISSVQYQEGTSPTVAPEGTWHNSPVSVAEGNYLWTKTTFSDGSIVYSIARQGVDGTIGTSPYMLSVYAPKGTVFNNGIVDGTTSLSLNAQFYQGTTDLTNDSGSYYLWEKYVNGTWVIAKAEASGSNGNTMTVNASDVEISMNYRCRARYGNSSTAYFYDTITVINKVDNYQATIESSAGDVFKNGVGDSVLSCRVWQAGVETDILKSTVFSKTAPLNPSSGDYYYKFQNNSPNTQLMRYNGTSWVEELHTQTYTWYRRDLEGDPMDGGYPFATSKVIYVTDTDIEGITTFSCEVGSIAVAQFTIRDDTDITISNIPPENPATDMLWLDTGVTPNVIKKFNGESWQIINDTSDFVSVINSTVEQAASDIYSTVDSKIAEAKLTEAEFTVMFGDTVESGINSSINQVQQNLDKYKTDVSVYMRYDSSGTLTLGNQADNFQTRITNQKMSFVEGNTEVAYISNNSMFITNARVTDTLSIGTVQDGYFDWVVTATGLGLKWRNT